MAQRILGDYRQIRRQVSLRAALRQYAPAEKAAAICVAASQPFVETFAFITGRKKTTGRSGEKGHYLWDLTRFVPR